MHVSNPVWILETGTYVKVNILRGKAWNILERCSIVKSHCPQIVHQHCRVAKRSTFNKSDSKRFLVNATSGHIEPESDAYKRNNTSNPVTNAIDAFYRFSRPHTVIGTVKFAFKSIVSMCWSVDIDQIVFYLASDIYVARILFYCLVVYSKKGKKNLTYSLNRHWASRLLLYLL